ncbi:MAG: amidase [Acidimicrobiales bacterium]|nr:amidase [Acidimicrobiales bacterium]
MSDGPWQGDVISLVEAYRSGERHPREEVQATLDAAADDPLNAVCHVDGDAALAAAEHADVSLPFGGVPLAVKELLPVAGWPDTEASVALADRVADADSIPVERLRQGGVIPTVQTTSSEFGGVNQTTTKLHGVTRNPWGPDRTPGGSSGGSAAGVAGGMFALATASDGGGSIRIPAGFCGLVGLKPTYGRVPKGPMVGNLTAVEGCVSRSVRDTARWMDVTNGADPRDPFSLPRVDGFENDLGAGIGDLRGLRVAIVPDLGCAVVAPETEEIVIAAAEELLAAMGASRVALDLRLPNVMGAWGLTGGIGLRKELGDRWPACAGDLTGMMRASVESAEKRIDLDAMVKAETRRIELNVAMGAVFGDVDVVLAATNPSTAFDAEGHLPSEFGGRESNAGNNGALTAPSNIYGNPAISLPAGNASDGLPVGLQVLAAHHREKLLLDIALLWERTRPWALTA